MADLPSGTVTFLFTDIEGSTRLLQELGRERYSQALADHERLLRSAFDAAGGQVIDTQGDAFFVAFRSAGDAARAAAGAQRALRRHRWPKGGQLAVRMGIHTGEPARGAERYVGLGVHKAARICSAGHGGQILLSKTTHDLLEDEGAQDFALDDLGEQRLKDLDRPEHLYQLSGRGLAGEFPPLRTVDPTPFAGQEGELADAAEAAIAPERRRRRRRELLAAALMGVIAAAVAVPLFALGGGHKSNATGPTIVRNSVVVIDPKTNKAVADIPVGENPGPIAYGEGAIWVGNLDSNTISRIDPKTLKSTPFGVSLTPGGVVVGAGSVWVGGVEGRSTRSREAASVLRLQPATGQVVDTIEIASALPDREAVAMAAGPNAIWVAHRSGFEFVRIDPATDEVTKRIGDLDPTGVAVYARAVWVSDRAGSAVVRLDGEKPTRTTISLGSSPYSIALAGGKLWVAAGRGEVWQISPASNSIDRSTPVGIFSRLGSKSIAGGTDSLWVARIGDALTAPAIVRINVRTLATTVITLPREPRSVVVGAGRVWVTIS
jgi:YVTN family beta-propeller protein